jgi:hypothetical protein
MDIKAFHIVAADKSKKLSPEKPDLGARLIRAFLALDREESRRTVFEFAERPAGGASVTSRR